MSHGSPALAALIVSLGGALAGRALAGRTVLAWVVRRNGRRDAD